MRKLWPGLSLLLVASVGCGEVKQLVDAAGDDDPVEHDASLIGDVTVLTHSRTAVGRIGGIDIIAINPDESVQTLQTNGNGEATVEIRAGASITAIYPPIEGGGGILFTFVGVEPGDQLDFGSMVINNGDDIAETMTGSFTNQGVTDYEIYHACGTEFSSGDPSTYTLDRATNCDVPAQDIHFYAFDGKDTMTRFGQLQDVAWSPGGVIPQFNGWQNATAFTATATNIPAEIPTFGFEMHVKANASPDHPLSGISGYTIFESGAPSGGTFTLNTNWGAVGDGILGLWVMQFQVDVGLKAQIASRHLPANATQFTVDQPVGVPWIDEVHFDAATREIVYTLDGTQAHDGVALGLGYSRIAPDGGQENYRWELLTPPGSDGENRFELPGLPAAFARFAPTGTDEIRPLAMLFSFADVPDYRTLRTKPEWEVGANTLSYILALVFEDSNVAITGDFFGKRAVGSDGILNLAVK